MTKRQKDILLFNVPSNSFVISDRKKYPKQYNLSVLSILAAA